MASTNFKIFDENGTNMLSDGDYGSSTQRTNGVQAGVASSQLQNKFQHQISYLAKAIADLIVGKGYNVNDTETYSGFANKVSQGFTKVATDAINTNVKKHHIEYIKTSGNWTVPAGVNEIEVYMVASGTAGYNGGVGGQHNGGVGGKILYFPCLHVTPGEVIAATVGATSTDPNVMNETTFRGASTAQAHKSWGCEFSGQNIVGLKYMWNANGFQWSYMQICPIDGKAYGLDGAYSGGGLSIPWLGINYSSGSGKGGSSGTASPNGVNGANGGANTGNGGGGCLYTDQSANGGSGGSGVIVLGYWK